jgi:hypothetical protein
MARLNHDEFRNIDEAFDLEAEMAFLDDLIDQDDWFDVEFLSPFPPLLKSDPRFFDDIAF